MFSGVKRRIDELGRIVIPKDIRNFLGIKEGDMLDISIDQTNLILKKYLIVDNYITYINELCDNILQIYNTNIIIYDREKIIYEKKIKYNYDFKNEINSVYKNRSTIKVNKNEKNFLIHPLIYDSDIVGIIIIEVGDNIIETEKILKYLSISIIKKIDNN